MALADTIIVALLGTALISSIIELGLSAYVVSVTDRRYYNYFTDLPSRADFLLFASLWTLLVTIFLLTYPMLSARKSASTGGSKWLVLTTLVLNWLTMVFWLAGFAAWAALFVGAPTGIAGAVLAFAVILWLLFLGLAILNTLTAVGVMASSRLGYSRMRGNRTLP